MITLFQAPPAWGLPSVSPFCMKLETYLRMTKVEYKIQPADIFKAPLGRMPYVELDGKLIGDSTLIIDKLKAKFGDPLDGALSPQQKAQALLLQRLAEDHLLLTIIWLRWSQEESWNYVRPYFKAQMPPLIGGGIVQLIRKGMLSNMRNQGMGQHTLQDIINFAITDLSALSTSLGTQSFFLGEQPTSVDAIIYSFVAHQIWVPWDSPVKQHGLSLTNLVHFCERMKQQYWN